MSRARTIALATALLAGLSVAPGQGTSLGETAARNDLEVLDTDRNRSTPCALVKPGHRPYVAGGCRTHAYAYSTALTIRTVFGSMDFGDCTTNIDITIGARGKLWFDELTIGGASPCNDVWPCAPPEVIALRKKASDAPPREKVPPWRGRILSATPDGYRATVEMCVDTCAGRYKGQLEIEFVRDDGWKMRAKSAGVGTGGLEVDAVWDLKPSSFEIAAAPAS